MTQFSFCCVIAMAFQIQRRATGSTPAVGSSSMTTAASQRKAAAATSFLSVPPLYRPHCLPTDSFNKMEWMGNFFMFSTREFPTLSLFELNFECFFYLEVHSFNPIMYNIPNRGVRESSQTCKKLEVLLSLQ